MTKPLDPEQKRKREILSRMGRQGRLGDYLQTLTDTESDEATALLEQMNADWIGRQGRRERADARLDRTADEKFDRP